MSVLVTCVGITVLADLCRILAAPGTRQRYFFATIEHAGIYPTLVEVFLHITSDVARGRWISTGVDLATTLVYLHLLWRFRRDNDDDWFNSGRPRRLLRTVLPRRHVAPAS